MNSLHSFEVAAIWHSSASRRRGPRLLRLLLEYIEWMEWRNPRSSSLLHGRFVIPHACMYFSRERGMATTTTTTNPCCSFPFSDMETRTGRGPGVGQPGLQRSCLQNNKIEFFSFLHSNKHLFLHIAERRNEEENILVSKLV